MAVYAGFRNLQEQWYHYGVQCQLTPNLFGARLEDQLHQLHQLGFRVNGALLSRMNGSPPALPSLEHPLEAAISPPPFASFNLMVL